MGTGTNIFDASFQQLERFRTTGAGSRALVDKLNGPVDWINKNHGVMPVPQQVMPERKGGAVAGGAIIKRLIVRSAQHSAIFDIVICTEPENVNASPPISVLVALPYLLRRTPFDGIGRTLSPGSPVKNYTYVGSFTRTSEFENGDLEQQRVSMTYFGGDEIYALNVPGILDPPNTTLPVDWLDLNVDARMWAAFG